MKTILTTCCSLLLLLVSVQCRADEVSLTINIIHPEGGTATGAGTYVSGTTVGVSIQAADGWYINNVVGPWKYSYFEMVRGGNLFGNPNFDVTTITSDYESTTLS